MVQGKLPKYKNRKWGRTRRWGWKYTINTKKENATDIASVNADSLGTQDSVKKLIILIKRKRIDISCVQGAHNERTDVYEEQNYAIFFGGNDAETQQSEQIEESQRKAGVAIVIRNDTPFIKNQ